MTFLLVFGPPKVGNEVGSPARLPLGWFCELQPALPDIETNTYLLQKAHLNCRYSNHEEKLKYELLLPIARKA